MPFEKDVFISYAHIDNQPLSKEMQGWISRFHESLETLLSMRLGQNAQIWRDEKLQGNDIFGDEIIRQFPKTALFVSVLTPRYLNSEWCTGEVREFCRIARQADGLIIDNKSRVFKVIKTPVETQDRLPQEVQETLGYEFYTFGEDENPLELDAVFGKDLEPIFLRKLNTLAWDIARLLKHINANGKAAAPETPSKAASSAVSEAKEDAPAIAPLKPFVYLAECSYDQREDREKIKAELSAFGYTVLPDRALPGVEADYVADVDAWLARCNLSIHLVGKSYGAVPDGPSQRSRVVLQNERAVAWSEAGALKRVIWLPEGTRSDQPQQQAFIKAVNEDDDVQFGADVITGDLEALKEAIHHTLKQLEKPEAEHAEKPETAGAGRRKMIYLICDERDQKNTLPAHKFLKAQGFEVKLPIFTGNAETVDEADKTYLTLCDAALLFYGAGDEGWKFTRENALKKTIAYRRGKPVPVTYTYLAEPVTIAKEAMIELDEPHLINGLSGFSEAAMQAFVEDVNGTRANP